MTRAGRLLAVALVLLGVAGLLVVSAASFGARGRRTSFTSEASVTAVEVDSAAGEVEVVAGPQGAPKVSETTRHLFGAPTIERTLVDGVLRLRARCPRLAAAACEVRYRIELPPTVAVRVRVGRGAVSVDGIAGAVDVTTGAGPIALSATSGPVTARTSAGTIEGVDLAAPFLDASTSAGSVRLTLTAPPGRIDVRSGAGAIDLAVPAERYRVETRTDAGKVVVTVAEDATSNYTIRATTDAGGIRIHPR